MARLEVEEVVGLEPDEGFLPWYVSWSGVFVGALSALALLLVFGLTGLAVGAHQIGQRFASWHEFRVITLAFSVFGSFLSFVLGGWAAARVTGTRRAETAMLRRSAGVRGSLPVPSPRPLLLGRQCQLTGSPEATRSGRSIDTAGCVNALGPHAKSVPVGFRGGNPHHRP